MYGYIHKQAVHMYTHYTTLEHISMQFAACSIVLLMYIEVIEKIDLSM
jgi:hypothetical protein